MLWSRIPRLQDFSAAPPLPTGASHPGTTTRQSPCRWRPGRLRAASDSMPRPVRLGMLAVAMIAATSSAVSGSAWPRPRPAAWRVRPCRTRRTPSWPVGSSAPVSTWPARIAGQPSRSSCARFRVQPWTPTVHKRTVKPCQPARRRLSTACHHARDTEPGYHLGGLVYPRSSGSTGRPEAVLQWVVSQE